MARQESNIRAAMHAMRTTLVKFTGGRTTGWGALKRNLETLMQKSDAYDSCYQSLVEFAADVESVTEAQLRNEAQAHQDFQGELLILRDEALVVIDQGTEEAAAQEHTRDKDKKLKLHGDRFKVAYDGIDAQLAEVRASFVDVDTTPSFEVLEFLSERVSAFEEAIESADNEAQAMAELDLVKTS